MRLTTLLLTLCLFPLTLGAQGVDLRFGGLQQDPSAPVEVTSNSLSIDQETGQAVFSGDVLVIQGQLRLSADQVALTNAADGSGPESMVAEGNVTLVSDTDNAAADRAEYDITTGNLILTGNVLLNQGATILSSERMVVDLDAGTARLEGRVRTVIQQGNN